MLKEFDYLGAEKAFEVAIENSNVIADMIKSDIRPIPKGVFMPKIPNAQEELSRICRENAHARYGENLPDIIENRLNRELELIAKFGFSAYYLTAKKLVGCSKQLGYPAGSRGTAGSTLTAFLLGVRTSIRCHHTTVVLRAGRFSLKRLAVMLKNIARNTG